MSLTFRSQDRGHVRVVRSVRLVLVNVANLSANERRRSAVTVLKTWFCGLSVSADVSELHPHRIDYGSLSGRAK